jgi:hypothetical protein
MHRRYVRAVAGLDQSEAVAIPLRFGICDSGFAAAIWALPDTATEPTT